MLKPLFPAFNIATLHMANRVNPRGWRVAADAPDTLAKLKARAKRDGVITVSSLHSDLTIYGAPEVNFAARAWHDACHILANAEFDDAGERAVCELQCAQLRQIYGDTSSRLFQAIVRAEVVGQLEYKSEFGEFPTDQRTFVRQYLAGYRPVRNVGMLWSETAARQQVLAAA